MNPLTDLTLLRKERNHLRDLATRRRVERHSLAVARMVDRAELDALALITAHVGGGATSRETSLLTPRRWAYAAGLLRLAGLCEPVRDLKLRLPHDAGETLRRLSDAAATARTTPPRWARHIAPSRRPALLSEPFRPVHQTAPHLGGFIHPKGV